MVEHRAVFNYELVGESDSLKFTETVDFIPPRLAPSPQRAEAFQRVVELLYLVAGISYYKVAAPPRIEICSVSTPAAVEAYLRNLYAHGLAEYAFRNNLPRALRPDFVASHREATLPLELPALSRHPLVPVGGGKDSVVTVELLRQAGVAPVLFSVNPNQVMRNVVAVAGTPMLEAKRTVDQQLFKLNELGAYNGHIPVTAINSLISVATAVLHGLGPVVMSNERSASSANLTWEGQEINHQWSKGLDAERELAQVLVYCVGRGVGYFSLLRPLSELHIARIFAKNTAYDAVFTSCNAVFKLRNAATTWCGNCPKCRFVFLALAPFMTRERLIGIFGTNLLSDATQLPGYRELIGLTGQKPFDCVGEIEESLVALQLVAESVAWKNDVVVQQLVSEVPATRIPTAETITGVFTPSTDHLIPAEYTKALPCV
ncbi:MAG: hypothetical protein DLM55_11545 [Acidimicrobiales bacterium]|nr:MAG: hypothetical protein DLM55_11545 [Acidimicrobiales bacterium]